MSDSPASPGAASAVPAYLNDAHRSIVACRLAHKRFLLACAGNVISLVPLALADLIGAYYEALDAFPSHGDADVLLTTCRGSNDLVRVERGCGRSVHRAVLHFAEEDSRTAAAAGGFRLTRVLTRHELIDGDVMAGVVAHFKPRIAPYGYTACSASLNQRWRDDDELLAIELNRALGQLRAPRLADLGSSNRGLTLSTEVRREAADQPAAQGEAIPSEAPAEKLGEVDQAILQALKGGRLLGRALATAAGYKYTYVRSRMSALIALGLVKKARKGTGYELP